MAAPTLLYILAGPPQLCQVFPLLQELYTELLVPFLGGLKVHTNSSYFYGGFHAHTEFTEVIGTLFNLEAKYSTFVYNII